METEIWKNITDFPNYEISNLGNIRNSNNKYIMKPFTNEAGYLRISLYNDTVKRKKFYIQRLVAQEFLENIENKPTVNHINNNPLDNRKCNLRIVTKKQKVSRVMNSFCIRNTFITIKLRYFFTKILDDT